MSQHEIPDPLTIPEVESEILRLSARLEGETARLAQLGQAAGLSEIDHKVARAQAFLKAEGPVDARSAQAEIATKDQMLARRRDEVLYDACRETLRTIRTQLDALRTIAANARAQA